MQKILIANQKGGCGKTSLAVTLASALANQNFNVALADADPQKSSLQWLKIRPDSVPNIIGIDWRDEDDIGDLPKTIKDQLGKDDWLIIDGQGAMRAEKTEQLIAECKVVIVPVLPSFFDIDSTKRFLKNLQDIKRVRKGKVEIYLVANRVRPQFFASSEKGGKPTQKVIELFDDIGQQPLTWISERSIYQLLAEHGLTVFDKTQKPYREIQEQWQPIFEVLGVIDAQSNITQATQSKPIEKNNHTSQKKAKNTNWYE